MRTHILATLGAMVATGGMAIATSMVHNHGDPLELFQPSTWALMIAIPMWIVVSFVLGRVVLHTFRCSCQKSKI